MAWLSGPLHFLAPMAASGQKPGEMSGFSFVHAENGSSLLAQCMACSSRS
jgi:hypothetical protein